ncbi:MAG: type II toxin-antitoxin system RelE/ParE family toxin [Deltaproteobacteria bacterium]|nr:type II toxin-antitoxin system RelE/ParE family toxin [Deltaproteobacteria bacterium]
MIVSFRHGGLEELFHYGRSKRINQNLKKRICYLLDMLAAATKPEDMQSTPGIHLHRLKGARKNQWSVAVNGPWRITFEFKDGHIHQVDLEQYH